MAESENFQFLTSKFSIFATREEQPNARHGLVLLLAGTLWRFFRVYHTLVLRDANLASKFRVKILTPLDQRVIFH